jgi:hypothetical protein
MKKELIKKQEDLKNASINAMTGEKFIIPQDDPEWLKAREISKDGLATIITPSGKKLEIQRRGVSAEEIGQIMSSTSLTVEEKNTALANYFVQENADNSMFAAEIFQSRGMFTKEARHFHTQMRYDFENFANMFESFLRTRARAIFKSLGLKDEDVVKLMKKVIELEGDTLKAALFLRWVQFDDAQYTLLDLAVGFLDEAETLKEGVDKLTAEREKLKGGGTYISKSGRIYNLHDVSIREIVEKEFLEENKKVEQINEQSQF